MLTLFHSFQSRATRMLALVHEMDIRDAVTLRHVSIARRDGSGGPDPDNPHPDKKVPALLHDGTLITETGAIMLYLTDMFPDAGMGPVVGNERRGDYLTWLFYYGGVMEPVYNVMVAGQHDNPVFQATFRGVPEVEARLIQTFADGRSYLLGDTISAADLLVQSPYTWFSDGVPDNDKVRAWVERVAARPSAKWAVDYEARLTEGLG